MNLEFKRTTSRGNDTYGYNIVSLYVDGKKKSSCMGGGYDMMGTALGDFVEKQFQEKLLAFADKANDHITYSSDGEYMGRDESKSGPFYGMTTYWQDGKPTRVALDGGCGLRAMETIVQELGYRLKYVSRSSNREVYTLEEVCCSQMQ